MKSNGTKPAAPPSRTARHVLITAGPTQEPIDAVRFIGNRSSGRLGVALADAAAARGWRVTLLLGPKALTPKSSQVEVVRFRTTADLEALLERHFREADVLIMAAAVADYRPRAKASGTDKIRRTGGTLTLELESTPDLLATCGKRRRPGQVLVGFALEPRDRLMQSAAEKVVRKGVDYIVANPLETMDAPTVEATLLGTGGVVDSTAGTMQKDAFAEWLLDRVGVSTGAGIAGAR